MRDAISLITTFILLVASVLAAGWLTFAILQHDRPYQMSAPGKADMLTVPPAWRAE